MRIFGIKFTAKKLPRYGSYEDVQALSERIEGVASALAGVYNSLEAMRKKVYRDDKKQEVLHIPDSGPEGSAAFSRDPGAILTEEQIKLIIGG